MHANTYSGKNECTDSPDNFCNVNEHSAEISAPFTVFSPFDSKRWKFTWSVSKSADWLNQTNVYEKNYLQTMSFWVNEPPTDK